MAKTVGWLNRASTPPSSPFLVASPPHTVHEQHYYFSPRPHSVNDALHKRSHVDSCEQRAPSVDAIEFSDDSTSGLSQQPTT